MNSINRYKPTDKMSNIIFRNYSLISVMSRFGLPLGFGEKTVKEICEQQDVDCNTFLAVVNFMEEEQYGYEYDAENDQISLPALMEYLKQAHSYFLDFNLPSIRKKLKDALELEPGKNDVTQSILIFYDKYENEVAGYVDFRQDISRWLTLNAGLRVDHHSRVGTEWIPQAGVAFHLPKDMELKASATKGFRYPILREMYMFPPQNPDLKPESMWNYEIAFSQRLFGGRLHYGLNLFYIDGKNLIMTLPNPNGGMLNQNSGAIDNAGVELQAAYRINRCWSVDANYSYLHMKIPVIAAPEHKLYAEANFTKGRWNVSSGIQYIAGLYTAVGDNSQTEDFVLWNVCGSFRATEWLSVWARGENLLAQRYEINAGYPMPKATFEGGVHLEF